MQAQRAHLARLLVAAGDAREREVDSALPRIEQVTWNEIMREEPVARLAAEAPDVERGPVGERSRRARCVSAPDEATDPFNRFAVPDLRLPPASGRKYPEAKAPESVQRRPFGLW